METLKKVLNYLAFNGVEAARISPHSSDNVVLLRKHLHALFRPPRPRITHSQLKYSLFKDSLRYRILIQILNTAFLALFELLCIFRMDDVARRHPASPRPVLALFADQHPALLLCLLFNRLSYLANILIKNWLHSNSKELEGLNRINLLLLLCLPLQTLLLALPGRAFARHFSLCSNANTLLFHLLVVELFMLLLPVPRIGKVLRIFLQMLKIVCWFTFLSFFAFIFVAFLLNRLFIEYHHDFNVFHSVYLGLLTLYEFAFGAVVYEKEQLSAYNLCLNSLLILFSFFGNVMLVNILIAYLSNKFNKINSRALFYTLQSQYDFYKVFPLLDTDGVYYIPFLLTFLSLPYLALLYFKQQKKQLNELLKIFSHFLLIVLPLCGALICLDCLMVPYQYLAFFKEILFSRAGLSRKLWLVCGWAVGGPFFCLYLVYFDNKNVLRTVMDYGGEEKRDRDSLKDSLQWKYLLEAHLRFQQMEGRLKEKYPFNLLLFEMLSNERSGQELRTRGDEALRVVQEFSGASQEKEVEFDLKLEFYKELLRGFSQGGNEFVNISFLERFMKLNLAQRNMRLIINYELEELKNAQFATIFEEEADLINSVNNISEKINLLVEKFDLLSG